jgi:cell division protein FtsB
MGRAHFEWPAVLDRLRSYLSTAALAFLIAYFAVQAFTGDRGILNIHNRRETLSARTAELVALRAERRDLEIRAQLLRNSSLSADLLEERARSLLGFANPRDYVIHLNR